MRDLDNPDRRIDIEVVLPGGAHPEVLAAVTADLSSPVLREIGVGDGGYAFHAVYSRVLTEDERDRVQARADGSNVWLEHAPDLRTAWAPWGSERLQGYLDARSAHHASGWVRNLDNPADKVEVEIILPATNDVPERVLIRLAADQFSRTLVDIGVGDGVHAFHTRLTPPLDAADAARLEARVVATGALLEHAPELRTQWEPIAHLAMDIVNNCNLRCPFCVVDYAGTKTTRFMADATFEAALRLIPYVTDGNFWLSCLHEATLHPRLMQFIDSVPRHYRHKLYYTTNLAKRMPESYFAAICDAGLHHLNISVESLDPPIYEKMRAGARFPIFQENWNRLLAHHQTGSAPPPLRYNVMCYRSNLHAIPALVQTLLDDKRAWQVELRHTYDVAHIPDDFRVEEFLSTDEWAWLKAALSHHDPSRVVLLMPPAEQGYDANVEKPRADPENDDAKFSPYLAPDEVAWNRAPQPFNLSMSWDGLLRVYGWKPKGPGLPDQFITYAKTNIHFLKDPLQFLSSF